MTSLIQKICRLSINTFRRDPPLQPTVFNYNLDQLSSEVNALSKEDLNIDLSLLEDRGHYNPNRDGAPVTYMQLFEDNDFTICVFILKRGVRLPLHDHPGMFGLLKVLYGQIAIQSFSVMDKSPGVTDKSELHRLSGITGLCPAIKHPLIQLSNKDPLCLLTPDKHNVHEIYAIDGPAAILDILSPPYGKDHRLQIDRDCHYFKIVDSTITGMKGEDTSMVYLLSIKSPSDFWCDETSYKGPPLVG